eukprot:11053022-Alexandrium_andersonii.AAC.1
MRPWRITLGTLAEKLASQKLLEPRTLVPVALYTAFVVAWVFSQWRGASCGICIAVRQPVDQ